MLLLQVVPTTVVAFPVVVAVVVSGGYDGRVWKTCICHHCIL